MKKILLTILTIGIVCLLLSCNDDGMSEQEKPKILSYRILGDSPDGLVEKDTFLMGGIENIYFEITAIDNELGIDKLYIVNIRYPEGNNTFIVSLDQQYQLPPQENIKNTYIVNVWGTFGNGSSPEYWHFDFYLTDKNGKKSNIISSKLKTYLH